MSKYIRPMSTLSDHFDSPTTYWSFPLKAVFSYFFCPSDRQQGVSLWVPFQAAAGTVTSLYKGTCMLRNHGLLCVVIVRVRWWPALPETNYFCPVQIDFFFFRVTLFNFCLLTDWVWKSRKEFSIELQMNQPIHPIFVGLVCIGDCFFRTVDSAGLCNSFDKILMKVVFGLYGNHKIHKTLD